MTMTMKEIFSISGYNIVSLRFFPLVDLVNVFLCRFNRVGTLEVIS